MEEAYSSARLFANVVARKKRKAQNVRSRENAPNGEEAS
jgi:hypothetical protein